MTTTRIAPATRREMGVLNSAITGVLGVAAGSSPPNLFTTVARHRKVFRPWLRFAAALMPGGVLPRRDTELVILRVAQLCGCEYEWRHHESLAALAGLTTAQVEAVREGAEADGWTARQAVLLEATDELYASTTWSDDTWRGLKAQLSERELIELPMLVGHYVMVAMTVNGLRIQLDEPQPPPKSKLGRAARAVTDSVVRRFS